MGRASLNFSKIKEQILIIGPLQFSFINNGIILPSNQAIEVSTEMAKRQTLRMPHPDYFSETFYALGSSFQLIDFDCFWDPPNCA